MKQLWCSWLLLDQVTAQVWEKAYNIITSVIHINIIILFSTEILVQLLEYLYYVYTGNSTLFVSFHTHSQLCVGPVILLEISTPRLFLYVVCCFWIQQTHCLSAIYWLILWYHFRSSIVILPYYLGISFSLNQSKFSLKLSLTIACFLEGSILTVCSSIHPWNLVTAHWLTKWNKSDDTWRYS